ncbi:3-deoxy-D-manno-octulosonate 8-phosphate phosphatase [Pasteurellaceae bacterium RH1A]|nr:3-deoxy-D-manno-octulosonate 8-phosphate phosphatase [Pasteurellaceae bacterium RH1A]
MQSLAKIKLVITDIDGVLTDGSLYYDANGESLKRFHVRDGLGMHMLMACGIEVGVISGGDLPALRARLAKLKLKHVTLGKMEKRSACLEMMAKLGVAPEEVAYIGDDTLDLPAFEACGLAVAVGDAPDYIKQQADLVLQTPGGHGAFRELSDMILKAQGKETVFATAAGFLEVVEKMGQ